MMRRSKPVTFLLAALLCAATAHAAPIYRTVDEHGNVTFSDTPPAEGQSGEQVELRELNTVPPSAFGGGRADPDEADPDDFVDYRARAEAREREEEAPVIPRYQVAVTAPEEDETLRSNGGEVTVRATVAPDLWQEHSMEVLLNGIPIARAPGGVFPLTAIDRGTHSVQVRVLDSEGTVLGISGERTFHLLRHSVLHARPGG